MMIGELKRAEMPKSIQAFKEEVLNFCTEIGKTEYDKDKAIEVLNKLYDYFADCSRYEKTVQEITSLEGVKSNITREIEKIKNIFPDIVKTLEPGEHDHHFNIEELEEEIKQ